MVIYFTELEVLRFQCKDSAKHAFAESTYKNKKTQLESYFMFCIYFELMPVPATVHVLTLYAQFLSRSFKSVDSIKNYLSSVRYLHLLLDLEYPQFEAFHLRLVLRGLCRIKAHCLKQALPITPHILLQIYKKLDMNSAYDATIWCLFLHAFFLMFRKSNLVPDSISTFDHNKQLCRDSIIFDCKRKLLLISVKWSKTIQFGERELLIPLVSIPDSPLCPVQAFLNMKSLVCTSDKSPAYCFIKHKLCVPVTYRQFQTILRQLITEIGLDACSYSTHSFRRGGASWAFAAEVPTELIQLYGDWKSDAYKRYLKFSLDDKISVAEKMTAHISDVLL